MDPFKVEAKLSVHAAPACAAFVAVGTVQSTDDLVAFCQKLHALTHGLPLPIDVLHKSGTADSGVAERAVHLCRSQPLSVLLAVHPAAQAVRLGGVLEMQREGAALC